MHSEMTTLIYLMAMLGVSSLIGQYLANKKLATTKIKNQNQSK